MRAATSLISDTVEEKLRTLYHWFIQSCGESNLSELFVDPPVKLLQPGTESENSAFAYLNEFIADEKTTSLIMVGDSGIGKSTVLRYFVYRLWEHLLNKKVVIEANDKRRYVPLYIPLRHIDPSMLHTELFEDYMENLIQTSFILDQDLLLYLKDSNIGVVIVLDGFDEIPASHRKNLIESNQWEQILSSIEWQVITSCRPSILQVKGNPLHWFSRSDAPTQELQLLPFNKLCINEYLKKHVVVNGIDDDLLANVPLSPRLISPEVDTLSWPNILNDGRIQVRSGGTEQIEDSHSERRAVISQTDNWQNWETYERYFDEIPTLAELVTNPFILSKVVTTLPLTVTTLKNKPNSYRLTRQKIYQIITDGWFDYQASRLRSQIPVTASNLTTEDLTLLLHCYTYQLASLLFQQRRTLDNITEEESLALSLLTPTSEFKHDEVLTKYENCYNNRYKSLFENKQLRGEILRLVRAGCLLKTHRRETQYHFLHQSLVEFFAARHLFLGVTSVEWSIKQAIMRKPDTIESKEDAPFAESINSPLESAQATLSFSTQSITQDPQIIQYLADEVKDHPQFCEQLFELIEASKGLQGEHYAIAAANAITVLCQAGVSFEGKDFTGIRIPGAICRSGFFANTIFDNADLTSVDFSLAWLDGASMKNAVGVNITFGQLPYLSVDECRITQIQPHPNSDLTWFIVSDDIEKLSWLDHLDDEDERVFYISAVDNQGDSTQITLNYSSNRIQCFGLSPLGTKFVTYSTDGKIHLATLDWETKSSSWSDIQLLDDESKSDEDILIRCFTFSPDDEMLAVATNTGDVYIDSKNSNPVKIQESQVAELRFSPDSQWLVTIGKNNRICIWESRTGSMISSFSEYEGSEYKDYRLLPCGVAFSPDKKILAYTKKEGSTIIFRMLPTTSEVFHESEIFHEIDEVGCFSHFIFSPDSRLFAAMHRMERGGKGESKIYLWNIAYKKLLMVIPLNPDSDYDTVFSFSQDSRILAVGMGSQMQQWDVLNDQSLSLVKLHESYYGSTWHAAFSPNNKRLAILRGSVTYLHDTENHQRTSEIAIDTVRDITNCYEFAFHPGNNILVTEGRSELDQCHYLFFWDIKTETLKREMEQPKLEIKIQIPNNSYMETLTFSPAGDKLLAVITAVINDGEEYSITVLYSCDFSREQWDVNVCHLNRHKKRITDATFSPKDGSIFFATSSELEQPANTIVIWEPDAKKTSNLGNIGMEDLILSQEGDYLAGTQGSKLYLILLKESKVCSYNFEEPISSLSFSPDGQILAICFRSENIVKLLSVPPPQFHILSSVSIQDPYLLRWVNDNELWIVGYEDNTFRVKQTSEQVWQVTSTSSQEYPLTASGLCIDGTQLSPDNSRLLSQLGAEGNPSIEFLVSLSRIIESRVPGLDPEKVYTGCPDQIPAQQSIVSTQRRYVNKASWMIHWPKDRQNPKNNFLIIEGISATGAAFFLPYRLEVENGFSYIRCVSVGQEKSQYHESDLSKDARESLLKKIIPTYSNSTYVSWSVSKEKGYKLITTLEKERNKPVDVSPESSSGSTSKFFRSENCFSSWVCEKLLELEILTKEDLPQKKPTNPSASCLVM